MRNVLILFSSLLFLYTSSTIANTLNETSIKQIHQEVKTILTAKCMKDMKDATDAICTCVAEKAQQQLDDSALAKCTDDEKGGPCISTVVKEATAKAVTQESVSDCKQKHSI